MAKINKGRVTGLRRPPPSKTTSKTSGSQKSSSSQKTATPSPRDQYERAKSSSQQPPPSALSGPDSPPTPATATPKDNAVPMPSGTEVASTELLSPPKKPPTFTTPPLLLEADCVTRLSEELSREVADPGADFQVITSGGHPIILTPSYAIKFVGEIFQEEELEAMNIYLALGEAVPQWKTISPSEGAETKATIENLTTCAEREKSTYKTILKKMHPLEAEQAKKQKNVVDHIFRLNDIKDELKSLDPSGQGNSYSVSKALEKCDQLLQSLKKGNSFLLGTRVKGENLGNLLLEDKYNATLFEDGAKDLNSMLFQMGRVAVKDLLTGNSDRLCELRKDKKDNTITLRISFNTGNLMLDPNDGISQARMVCIDNGMSLRLSNEEFQSGIDSHFNSLPDKLWERLKMDHFTPEVFSSTKAYQAHQEVHPNCDDEFRSWLREGINAGLSDLKTCNENQLPNDSPLLRDRLAILKKVAT